MRLSVVAGIVIVVVGFGIVGARVMRRHKQ